MNIIKPKRSLGQNFMINKNLSYKITEIVLATNPNLIVEIGPGTGVFTHLLAKDIDMIAIEKDENIYNLLKGLIKPRSVKLINEDILSTDLEKLVKGYKKPLVAFGSLPYNLSKRIIAFMLKTNLFEHHFYIIQKEVAEKYVDKKSSNRLSIMSSLYSTNEILRTIAPGNFSPKPKVMSSLIHFKREIPQLNKDEALLFRGYLDRAFKSPRKKLKNNISIPKLASEKQKLFFDKRPSELTKDEYLQLYKLKTAEMK